MKRYLLFMSFLTSALLYAQDYKTCGTDEMMEKVFKANPTLRKKSELLKQEVNSYVKNRNPKNDDEIYVIPVVVHIIHNGGSNNISDAQVHDAMRIINLDYKKLNSDTSQVISEFTHCIMDLCVRNIIAAPIVNDMNNNRNHINFIIILWISIFYICVNFLFE